MKGLVKGLFHGGKDLAANCANDANGPVCAAHLCHSRNSRLIKKDAYACKKRQR